MQVFDNWESSPGASVLAGGEKTTREGRLLAWATEIESLFSSQVSWHHCPLYLLPSPPTPAPPNTHTNIVLTDNTLFVQPVGLSLVEMEWI